MTNKSELPASLTPGKVHCSTVLTISWSIVDETTFDALEYHAVLKELETLASTALGRELVAGLRPSSDFVQIQRAYDELREAVEFTGRHGTLPLGGISDIRGLMSRLRPGGAYLLPDELLEVKHTVESILLLKGVSDPALKGSFPIMASRLDSLSTPRSLFDALSGILDERGEIKDDASGRLREIREDLAASRRGCRRIIEELVKDRRVRESLQDEFFTIRDDRYVLCVRAGFHTRFPGVVHGRSSSGAAYFIEPFQVVELNNRVAILKKEEKQEEIEVLKRASSMVLSVRDRLYADLSIAAALDFIQAKALFKGRIRGVIPVMKKDGGFELRAARHPVLVFKELRGETTVVPVDILLRNGKKVLVISGANTGGKTVALKTVGLLTIMAQSALPVPAAEDSEILFFERVFADIGDRQDITEDLSTFSAHLKRTGEILAKAGPSTLVLIDEIGVGTDPAEGSVFALSILEAFRRRGAVAVVTTHLNLLKAHAQVDRDFDNASVEFDEETLRPLYKLRYGMPGPSLGLSIAGRYGIPDDVIEAARQRLEGGEGAFVKSMRMVEDERKRLEELRKRLERTEELKLKALERLRGDRKRLLESARRNVDRLVSKAGEEIRALVEGQRSGAGKKASEELERVKQKVMPLLTEHKTAYIPAVGDVVAISGSSAVGTVIRVDDGRSRAEVLAGNFKVWVDWARLVKVEGRGRDTRRRVSAAAEYEPQVPMSVNLIGSRADEAVKTVSRVIDDAHMKGVERIELIHGIGTGALKRAIHEHLKTNPLVKGFYEGDGFSGGAGVTIVEVA